MPISVSSALSVRRKDLVQLEAFDAVHTQAWNSDSQRWKSSVSAWLSGHLLA